MHRPRTLRSRLLSWFLSGILLALMAGALVTVGTRPDPVTGAEAMARNIATRLAASWDDPEATRAFVDEVRDVTGFETRLVRDPHKLPPRVHAEAAHGLAIVPENPQHIFLPVVRQGTLAGAVEMEKFGPRQTVWHWWRLALGLVLVVAVLSLVAGRVANQLARPLERLAEAADRFGEGDLAFRTDVGRTRRWVALEVREVAVSFNRMADRLEALVRGQRELLGAISHELRSPLGRARVALEIARDRLPATALSSERSPAAPLDDVERQLEAIDSILRDLLDVTRAGLADLRMETRPFAEWLGARVAEEPTAAPARPTTVETAPDARGVSLAFDPALLSRAVHNLLVNARSHGQGDDRPPEVRLERLGDALRVVVRDHGPGFPEGFADRAFEPFVRGDAARVRPTAGAGYGLGLAIVRRVVEAHGGRVFARDAQDGAGGAEVGFDLPLTPKPR